MRIRPARLAALLLGRLEPKIFENAGEEFALKVLRLAGLSTEKYLKRFILTEVLHYG